MERPPKKYVCEKCGYLGDTSEHEGCDYLAWTTGEQLYIDHLEAELAARRASPASVPEGQKPVASVFADEDCTKFIAKNMSHLRPMAKWWDLYIVPQADAPTPTSQLRC